MTFCWLRGGRKEEEMDHDLCSSGRPQNQTLIKSLMSTHTQPTCEISDPQTPHKACCLLMRWDPNTWLESPHQIPQEYGAGVVNLPLWALFGPLTITYRQLHSHRSCWPLFYIWLLSSPRVLIWYSCVALFYCISSTKSARLIRVKEHVRSLPLWINKAFIPESQNWAENAEEKQTLVSVRR